MDTAVDEPPMTAAASSFNGPAYLAARLGDSIGAHGSWLGDVALAVGAGLVAAAVVVAAALAAPVVLAGAALAVTVALAVGVGASVTAVTAKVLKRHNHAPKRGDAGLRPHLHGSACSAIAGDGSPDVVIEREPAARADLDLGGHGRVLIAQGSRTVLVNGQPLARENDAVRCGGKILHGSERTWVGGPPSADAPDAADGPLDALIKWGTAIGALGFVAALAIPLGPIIAEAGVGAAVAYVIGNAVIGAECWVMMPLIHESIAETLGEDAADVVDIVALTASGAVGARHGALSLGNPKGEPKGTTLARIAGPGRDEFVYADGAARVSGRAELGNDPTSGDRVLTLNVTSAEGHAGPVFDERFGSNALEAARAWGASKVRVVVPDGRIVDLDVPSGSAGGMGTPPKLLDPPTSPPRLGPGEPAAAAEPMPGSGKTMAEVEPIHEQRGKTVYARDHLPSIVEEPALPAAEDLYDRNVQTIDCNAHARGGDGAATIVIDYDTLSPENQAVAARLGTVTPHPDGGRAVSLRVPFTEKTPVAEVQQKLRALAQQFSPQRADWAGLTPAQLERLYAAEPGEYSAEEWAGAGWYYDEVTSRYYRSVELREKAANAARASEPPQAKARGCTTCRDAGATQVTDAGATQRETDAEDIEDAEGHVIGRRGAVLLPDPARRAGPLLPDPGAPAPPPEVRAAFDAARDAGRVGTEEEWSRCWHRVEVWTRAISHAGGPPANRIFVTNFDRTPAFDPWGRQWDYHVAPVVGAGGEQWVIDPAFFEGPVTAAQWRAFFSRTGVPNSTVILPDGWEAEGKEHWLYFDREYRGFYDSSELAADVPTGDESFPAKPDPAGGRPRTWRIRIWPAKEPADPPDAFRTLPGSLHYPDDDGPPGHEDGFGVQQIAFRRMYAQGQAGRLEEVVAAVEERGFAGFRDASGKTETRIGTLHTDVAELETDAATTRTMAQELAGETQAMASAIENNAARTESPQLTDFGAIHPLRTGDGASTGTIEYALSGDGKWTAWVTRVTPDGVRRTLRVQLPGPAPSLTAGEAHAAVLDVLRQMNAAANEAIVRLDALTGRLPDLKSRRDAALSLHAARLKLEERFRSYVDRTEDAKCFTCEGAHVRPGGLPKNYFALQKISHTEAIAKVNAYMKSRGVSSHPTPTRLNYTGEFSDAANAAHHGSSFPLPEDWSVVDIHGSPRGVAATDKDGKAYRRFNAKELAHEVVQKGYRGGPLRLDSCSVGRATPGPRRTWKKGWFGGEPKPVPIADGLAQQFTDALNRELEPFPDALPVGVIAPSQDKSPSILTNADGEPRGRWRAYFPQDKPVPSQESWWPPWR